MTGFIAGRSDADAAEQALGAGQGLRRRGADLDLDHLARLGRAFKVDRLVVADAATDPGRVVTARAFDQDIHAAADEVVARFENANKGEFYPTVAELLCALGYNCEVSRGGVNYQRWDAFINHPTDSVPVEIKSPGEERFISVKGVRQALENKVILLSRKAAPTKVQTTSLVVGFLPPNDRAEVAGLIGDVYSAFGVTIGVVDFRSLALMAASAVNGIRHDSETFLRLKGFIDVASP